jgi:hypothetical protein
MAISFNLENFIFLNIYYNIAKLINPKMEVVNLMKLYRYMSREELDIYKSGGYVVGRRRTRYSNSDWHGVCFLGEVTKFTSYYEGEGEEYSFTPKKCATFLCGIVANDLLVEFEVLDQSLVSEDHGIIYADPINGAWEARISITEYSMERYSQKELRLLNAWFVESLDKILEELYAVSGS